MSQNDESKQRVQEQFGQNAEKYVTSETHAHGSDLALGLQWLDAHRSDVALDVATGGGHVAKALAPLVKTVVVTDLTSKMLETARNHLLDSAVDNAQYVLADAEQLPFLAHSFDIVTCRIAPHHFPDPDAFVREVARVLRPGGRFLLIDNVAPDEKALADFVNLVEAIRDPSHVECLSVAQWTSLLLSHGFSIQSKVTRKKTHAFRTWLDRMAPTDAHRLAVRSMLEHATPDLKSYFEIVTDDEGVSSFATDEWITLAVKR